MLVRKIGLLSQTPSQAVCCISTISLASRHSSNFVMPPALPPKPLGIYLGSRAATTTVDVFVDPCCPFSKKIFLKLLEVHDWAESTSPGKLCVRVFLYPQPWHPQSTMLKFYEVTKESLL
jgi:hypothetical protein